MATRSRRRLALGPVLLAAALSAVACGGGGSDEEPTLGEDDGASQATNPDPDATLPALPDDLPDPCELVPADEAEDATGLTVTETASQQVGPASSLCAHLVDDEGTVGVSVGVSRDDARTQLDSYSGFEDSESVDGLGDDATWAPTLDTVSVVVDDTLVSVQVLDPEGEADDDALLEQARTMAEAALGRL